jgi:lipopolysaccharide export LptBFGC system permease protein LptF
MVSALYTAGIILGLTFLFIFFFSLLYKRGKQKAIENKKAKYASLVSSNNLIINEKEEFNNYLIAIDTVNGKILYLNFSNPKEEAMVIDLRKIKASRVEIEENHIYEEKKGKSILIEKQYTKIQLELTAKDAGQPKAVLILYQLYKDGMDDFKTVKKRAEHWQSTANAYINQLTNFSK